VGQTQKYCHDHTPKSCSLVLFPKSDIPQQDFKSTNVNLEDFSNKKNEKCSPRNVLDLSDGDYHSTEDDSSSFEGSTITESPPPLMAQELKEQSSFRKYMSSLKHISSFLRSPFEQEIRKKGVKLPIKEPPPPLLKFFSYEELANAINNFHQDNIVGIGGYSEVYKGKKDKHLGWPERYKIAFRIARGLHYLHTCCKHRVIHRDIKASNVLLGPDFKPQISDFGLAKWLPSKWTHHVVLPIEWTFGYLAPEYFMHGIIDEKIDVFAFRVLLLEIITGHMPVDSEKRNLVLWVSKSTRSIWFKINVTIQR
nr:probable receptor-like serine/threonine-protein kinase At5g57670 isoform X2 [Tanacetum cinerariifolium]